MLTQIDAAWVAGLLEGEGCFFISWTTGYPRFSIKCNMTDRDVVERLRELCGGRVAGPYSRTSPTGNPAKDQWVWTVGRRDNLFELLTDLLPFMGERRTAKIQEMMKALADYPGNQWHHGRSAYEARNCRCDICREAFNAHQREYRKRRKEREGKT